MPVVRWAVLSHGVNLAHGIVEGMAKDLDGEVDGVAGQIAFRPAPVAVFDDEAGIGWQNKIAGRLDNELKPALLEQRHKHGTSYDGTTALTT